MDICIIFSSYHLSHLTVLFFSIAPSPAMLYGVEQGTIKIGGIDIRDMESASLMETVSFVFQDNFLFKQSIMDNIRMGRSDATEAEVIAASKVACCDEFVQKLPDGYHTMLGENGSTLSGGERQRISIARTLLKYAPIILLDEATASLDPENEVLIQEAISRFIAGKTVLVIAHRLRTIVVTDQIIVLENDHVAECGSHNKLMEKLGTYRKLYEI